MYLKEILAIPVILAAIFFLYGPGSRLLKKKSHHHIVPPDPEKDSNWLPIDMDEYKKYQARKTKIRVQVYATVAIGDNVAAVEVNNLSLSNSTCVNVTTFV